LFEILGDYFRTNFVVAGILLACVALVASISVFIFARNYNTKSVSLLTTMGISSSLWIFVFSSLAFCIGFMGQYGKSPDGTILNVARLALLPTLVMGPIVFYFLRTRAMKQIYPFFALTVKGDNSGTDSIRNRTSSLFSRLIAISKLTGIGLSIVPSLANLPVSAALDWKGEKIVAISTKATESLDDDELNAVLAHEIGHIAHRDSLRKTMATAYRTAFVFDPLARFVEAAVYRDGELYADEYSAKLTGKPAALASALIKIYESVRSTPSLIPDTAGLSLLMKNHEAGIFSKQPSLTLRIKRLLEMERRLQSGSLENQEKPSKKNLLRAR